MTLPTHSRCDSSLNVVTKLWNRRLRNHGSISGRNKMFVASAERSDVCGTHPAFCSTAAISSFPWCKLAGHEVDHSLPSSPERKNEWSYTSAPAMCLHAIYRDTFTFTVFIAGVRVKYYTFTLQLFGSVPAKNIFGIILKYLSA